MMKTYVPDVKYLSLVSLLSLSFMVNAVSAKDPLPSWNETGPKKAIINFVERTTKEGSPDFVPIEERIAVYDNDGTLWAEQPMYFQLFFTCERIKALASQHPEWKNQQPYKAVLEDDYPVILKGGVEGMLTLLMSTHAGMNTEEFEKIIRDWIVSAKHPKTGKLYTNMIYQPMKELLDYLRVNGFKNYIVSGGSVEFMRPWTERVYGIPPEQVIGSTTKLQYEVQDGHPVFIRLPELDILNDKGNKPLGIVQRIGRRPIAAFGNSDGDLNMLQYTADGSGPRFCLYIHHTDAEREWAYDHDAPIGRLEKGLDEAKTKGWPVVDMKNDWNTVFPVN